MINLQEPNFDVAQLAHIELLTPDLDGTLFFFKELLGLQETERSGASVYLRAFEEHYHHSLKITEAPLPGLGHVAWRASSPQALERRAAALERSGQGRSWIGGDRGHGRAFQFDTPEGHRMELFWEVDYFSARPDAATALFNRPQRRPLTGIPVRRLDHFNLMAADPGKCRDFMVDVLGHRERERIVDDETGAVLASFLSFSNLSHDMAFLGEPTAMRGRLHHICFFLGSIQGIYELAEVAREAGLKIEAGPGRHGIGQGMYLYITEPGGNRVEVIGDTGYLCFDPAFKTVEWKASQIDDAGSWVGNPLPWAFFNQGTPLADILEPRMVPETV